MISLIINLHQSYYLNNNTKTYPLENIDLFLDFKDPSKPRSDLKCDENRPYDEHSPYKTQQFKGIHSTVKGEIIDIDSLYSADLENNC